MTIPKSYEALAADLASEKLISKTLQGQKEAYMMLADQRKFELDGAIHRESLSNKHLGLSLEREAALREELAELRESYEAMRDRKNSIVDLQQRLTVAEQRAVYLEGLLREAATTCRVNDLIISANYFESALKPAAEGEGS